MLGTGFDILTPISKLHRVSYRFDKEDGATFNPGEWGELLADGTMAEIGATKVTGNYKLVLTRVSDSEYESHDVEGGRITAIDTPACRVMIGSNLMDAGNFTGISAMDKLTPAAGGKLKEAATGNAIVGIVQEVHADHIIYEIAAAGLVA